MARNPNVKVTLDDKALSRLLTSKDGEVGKWLTTIAADTEAEAKRIVSGAANSSPKPSDRRYLRVQSGRLRASITHRVTRDNRGLVARIESPVGYALAQHGPVEVGRTKPYRASVRVRAHTRNGRAVSSHVRRVWRRPFLSQALRSAMKKRTR